MRSTIINCVFVLWTGLSAAGCLVGSIAPAYNSDQVALDLGLPGTWVNEEKNTIWTIQEPANESAAYIIEMRVSVFGQATGSEHPAKFEGRLFTVGRTWFLDTVPVKTGRSLDSGPWLPVHTLFRLQRDGDELRGGLLHPEKLDALIHANRIVLSHLHLTTTGEVASDSRQHKAGLILTGSTAELQAFLRAHLTDEIFETSPVMRRQR